MDFNGREAYSLSWWWQFIWPKHKHHKQ